MEGSAQIDADTGSVSAREDDRVADTRSALAILADASPAELQEAQLTRRRYREIIRDRAQRDEDAFERIARAARLRG
jgi:hypothetical protein